MPREITLTASLSEEQNVIEQTDATTGKGLGVEVDHLTSIDDSEQIVEPFDPEDIDVITRTMTVDLLLSRTESNMIDLQPDFQRGWGIWDNQRQSRLLESLLLRIPLPVLYAAEDTDERWEIVDGIQRLSTIARFIKPTIIQSKPLTLTGLEYLLAYEGKKFEELSPRMQIRLRETELLIHLIRKGTPPEVKFNIFARINTGGMVLSRQELRHAITPGRARLLLKEWAKSNAFLRATNGSVRPTRMDDRELVLRFIAFHCRGTTMYTHSDMDGFLIDAMNDIDEFSESRLEEIRTSFLSAMRTSRKLFDDDSFRKRYSTDHKRYPINKALFEAISVNLGNLDVQDQKTLISRRKGVQKGLMNLCNDRLFELAISQGTGDVGKVRRRFSEVQQMLGKVLENA